MPLPEDRLLLARFRQGDREAMAAVFHSYADRLAGYLQRGFVFESGGERQRFAGLASRHDLHDLVSETFRRAFEERARLAYDGLGPYEHYLKAIARNLVLDTLRRGRQLEPFDDGQAQPGARSAAPEQPERAACRAELAALMRQLLDRMSQPERALVSLRFEEGLSQEQAALRLRRTRRWVRSTERSIRAQVLQQMKHTGYLPAGRTRER